jgi:hypothetical protein
MSAIGAFDDDRVFGVGRQEAADLLRLGDDFRQRFVGVGAEAHAHLNRA